MVDIADSEQISMFLSKYLESMFVGTREEAHIKQRVPVLTKYLSSNKHRDSMYTGSFAEGILLPDSDMDMMIVERQVAVMYPNQDIPPEMADKSILYMQNADCAPGYVHLQVARLGHGCPQPLLSSIVEMENSAFLSSDIFREQYVSYWSELLGLKYESNGPSCTFRYSTGDIDTVHCFPCKTWPNEAKEWITRTRLYGWPHQGLINKIVNNGCHLVPVGDKSSNDTLLQWRISFASAEVSLVHSFSHIQLKVYALLKYFLNQIKDKLRKTIGDDDILSSYYLKTTLFHAIENSDRKFWQEKNLFYCFWFCFNILIAWVRAGFCPQYFIPSNNLFKRKIHGQNQRTLLEILNNYCHMKRMCLSVGNSIKPTIWQHLNDTSIREAMMHLDSIQSLAYRKDALTAYMLMENRCKMTENIKKAMTLLSTSQSDLDEVITYNFAMNCLQDLATEQVYPDHLTTTDNKTRYRSLRKCKRWMAPSALMGTDRLYLATFHFLTGNICQAMDMCKQVVKLASYYQKSPQLHQDLYKKYKNKDYLLECTLTRLQNIFTHQLIFREDFYLPPLCLEMSNFDKSMFIPPLPYALFLYFMCCHKLGNTRGCEESLRHLAEVQEDTEQGVTQFWIVPILLGICYQTIGQYHLAIRAYWKSSQSTSKLHALNTAKKRIAVVYLCMYASQRCNSR